MFVETLYSSRVKYSFERSRKGRGASLARDLHAVFLQNMEKPQSRGRDENRRVFTGSVGLMATGSGDGFGEPTTRLKTSMLVGSLHLPLSSLAWGTPTRRGSNSSSGPPCALRPPAIYTKGWGGGERNIFEGEKGVLFDPSAKWST